MAIPADTLSGLVALRRRRRGRAAGITLGLAAVLLALWAIAMGLGDYPLPPADVIASLLSPFTGQASASTDFIVLGVRLPRALTAIVAGGAFGLSGMIFQTVLRNPLASPDIIGIASGASAGAVFCIIALGWSGWPLSGAALAGALLSAGAVYLLAGRGVSPYRLVLIGIGVAAILNAIIAYLFTRARIEDAQRALSWMIGSLNGAGFEGLLPLAMACAVLMPAAILLSRPLAGLQLGDDTATALGTPVALARIALLLVGVALSAFATAVVGPLAFVAFVSGPIARKLLGAGGSGFLPAALCGGIVTLGADQVAQHFVGTSQMPAGVVTGAFGAAFLIWLLIVSNRTGRGG